jgi:hypothetical protein
VRASPEPGIAQWEKRKHSWRDHAWLAAALVLIFCFTRGYYLGDTAVYMTDAAQYFGRAPAGAGNLLWEFGHLLWRPLGWAWLEISSPAMAHLTTWGPSISVGFFFTGINLLCAAATVLLWHSLALETVVSRAVAFLIALGFACGGAFLSYAHSGSSYVPGLFCVTLAIWVLRRSGRSGAVGRSALAASAALTALGALLWFPWVLSAPGVLFIGIWPSATPSPSVRIRQAARFSIVLLVCLALGFGVGAAAQRIRSVSQAKAWVSASSHGLSQSNRVLRLATGLPRSFFYLGKDGVLYKRFLLKDPFAPVTVAGLVQASLWKIALFHVFLLCLGWELVRTATARWALLALVAGALPTVLFAVSLFEPGAPERYIPAYPFLVLAVAWVLRNFPRAWNVPQLVIGAFLLSMCISSLYSMNRFRVDQQDQPAIGRMMALKAQLRDHSLVAILSNQDDLSAMCNRNPLGAVNRPAPLRLYDIVEPATLRVLTWREEFAQETLAAWAAGGDVWVSRRVWQQTPRPEWNWVEGDDPRVSWEEIPRFFAPLETDQATGGADDFVRLKHNHDNVTRLAALPAYHPLP